MNSKIEQGDAVVATQYKMTTDIPASILTPEEVETRLGTLRFFDGFPDAATVQALYDNLDFQRAVEAYLQSLPAVQMLGVRNGLLQWGPANRTVVVWEELMDSRTLAVGGNANTVYWGLWLDTHDGPQVLEISPQVLGTFNDAWTRWVVDLGITGPDGGQGGKYLLLPPGYTGQIPDGYFVVRPLTFNLLAFFRTLLVDGDPQPGIERCKAHLRCYPLAEAAHPGQMSFVNVSGKPFNMIGPADASAFAYLDRVVQEEPSEATDPNSLGLFASIGIQKGRPFAPDARMQGILAEAAQIGNATARAITYRYRRTVRLQLSPQRLAPVLSWRLPLRAGRGAAVGCLHLRLLSGRPGGITCYGSEDGGERLAVCPGVCRCARRAAGREQDVPAAPARTNSGQGLLVAARVRHPNPLDAADRSAAADGLEPDPRAASQRRYIGGRVFRPRAACGHGEQLGANRSGQGMVHGTAPLWTARAVVRQDLATWGD